MTSVVGPRTPGSTRTSSFWAAPAIDPPKYDTDPCDPVDAMNRAAHLDRAELCDFCIDGWLDRDHPCTACKQTGRYIPETGDPFLTPPRWMT